MSNVADQPTDDPTKEIGKDDVRDMAAHTDELRELVMRKADDFDDRELYLAARSLEDLNERLGRLEGAL